MKDDSCRDVAPECGHPPDADAPIGLDQARQTAEEALDVVQRLVTELREAARRGELPVDPENIRGAPYTHTMAPGRHYLDGSPEPKWDYPDLGHTSIREEEGDR